MTSPWIDVAPATALNEHAHDEPHTNRGKLISALTLAGVYLGFSGWAYLAWYRDHPEKDQYEIGGDGWFGKTTYAGGADKLGHAWATMVLARAGTQVLSAGGWDHTRSAILSSVLAEGLFFAVEMKDYYYYEFSPGDMTFNTLGALAALAFELSPRLDEMFDYRVQYWPSHQYIKNLEPGSPCAMREPGQPSCSRWNIAEDYSGETYLIAFHPSSIHALRDWKYGVWSRFIDAVIGFESRNYKPPPRSDDAFDHRDHFTRSQELFFGVSLNGQGIFDYFLDKKSTIRKIGHGVFEVIQPVGAIPLVGGKRDADKVSSGGA